MVIYQSNAGASIFSAVIPNNITASKPVTYNYIMCHECGITISGLLLPLYSDSLPAIPNKALPTSCSRIFFIHQPEQLFVIDIS